MTIYDISKKAGVSIATVSRVLNGSDKVRPSTRKKVLDIIEKYDYAPNAYARGMGLGSLRTIGILCADSSDPFLSKAVYYIEQELQAHGYESLLCCTGYDLDIRQHYLNLILSKKVDSIILAGSNFIRATEEENRYIMDAAAKVPIMVLNAVFDHPNVYSIACDDHAAMSEAAATLLDAGIRDILYLYNATSYCGMKKLKGFCDTMEANGITDYEKLIQFYDGDSQQINDITAFVEQAAAKLPAFHGAIAADDSLAVGIVKYAQKKGLHIPKDLSIIGYNNSMLTECCTPDLTSVDNRLDTLTHELVQTLLGVLSGQEMPHHTILPARLVKRGTTLYESIIL